MRFAKLFLTGIISLGLVGLVEPSLVCPLQSAVVAQDQPKAFSVSAELFDLYVVDSAEEILANGKRYLVADNPPEKISVALIVAEGDIQNWIVVRRVMGGRSSKLSPFAANQFIYEHQGQGEYEVTTLDSNREPVFSYFVVGKPDPPPTDPGDPTPPPGDFAELIEVARANANNDLATRKALGKAWSDVLQEDGTLAEIKSRAGQARADVLSTVRDQDGSWNKFLLSIDSWFKSNSLDKDQYVLAMQALSNWMQE